MWSDWGTGNNEKVSSFRHFGYEARYIADT